jgi:hypothetical protein
MNKHTMRAGLLVTLSLLSAIPAAAQDTGGGFTEQIRYAMGLPKVAQQARTLGVTDADLRTIFGTARRLQLPPATVSDLLTQSNDDIRKNGPIDNFGAFVQQKLDAGLRGRELAAAIHAEHAARGMGKGRMPGAGNARADMPSQAVTKAGKPESPGKSGEQGGKPESPGKSGDNKGGGK